ncbi:MAG: FHIPEP family type III secretion protein [Phycisphaerales bacterium]|nr:FHIPEP family type III secretion protein [Planctomycetota bacterium]MBL6997287.1 FHIPEP family type III secretion protein [Phycisphaerales bacterium]
MNQFDSILSTFVQKKHLLVPSLLLGLVTILVVPLPPGILDFFLAANISIAAVILLTTVYTKSPLDFSVFPALLLITTLGRLVLNVASTRLILSADATTPEQGGDMAGHVIEAFGSFVAGSSIIVGGIIFLILVIVQFVVVTKGATRMSEVAARFTLDAMPGRQMAIDADLSTGLINEKQATNRRDNVLREADFYGAMDGASKFVRGDAIAGLVIIAINIVGGLTVGVAVKGWSVLESADLFTRLTIGDGLASQVPSFLIAIAAGLIVARAGNRTPLGMEIPNQLVSQPAALGLVAGFLVLLSITPLPTLPLLVLAAVLGGLSWISFQRQDTQDEGMPELEVEEPPPTSIQESVLTLEFGQALLPLASAQREDNIVEKMASLRLTVSQDLGLMIPSIRIKDNLSLDQNSYRILLKGGVVGEGVVYNDRRMIIPQAEMGSEIEGIPEREPAFGMSAVWVTNEVLSGLGDLFVQAVGPVSVIMTHLSAVVNTHAKELLCREDVALMIDSLSATSPRLVEEEIGSRVSISRLHHILKALLSEHVPIMDLSTIIEAASDSSTESFEESVEQVRVALKRQICASISSNGDAGRQVIRCLELPEDVDEAISRDLISNDILSAALHHAAIPLVEKGLPIVVISSNKSRRQLKTRVANTKDEIVVLSRDEIVQEVDLQVVGKVETMRLESRTIS